MYNSPSPLKLLLGKFLLALTFISVINYMTYLTLSEYKILSKSEWTVIQLNTDDHLYSVQQLKKEDKLIIKNVFPDLQAFEIYCDSKLFELCNYILNNQISIKSFSMDLGRLPNYRFTLRLRKISYLDQNQQQQTFIYTYTPANSEAKIKHQFKISLASLTFSILCFLVLITLIYRDKDLINFLRNASILGLFINIFGLFIYSFQTLI
ncbi:hypothetical protein RFI02_12635 [Acinetobacter sichuanensis]|uniref:hypothetical protein n=1 Tax=Acinetobacter sichuanensis TaxID=2136183 RepID=UPI00280EEF87|nr:hypothetical protein [Acinetobacter sichuanensis]MDQ9021950.1 hypothetical protein [Acinetobacter sichuanensis]